jgi:hypothetical protein
VGRREQHNDAMTLNPEGTVYGTLAIGAMLAAESAPNETYPKTVTAVVITLLVYWLAHAYSDYAGERWRGGEKLELGGLGRMLVRELSILIGAAVPLVVVLISWATGAALSSAVTAAIWTSAAMVVVIEVAAGLRAEQSGYDLLKQVALGAVLGVLVIALKLVLH